MVGGSWPAGGCGTARQHGAGLGCATTSTAAAATQRGRPGDRGRDQEASAAGTDDRRRRVRPWFRRQARSGRTRTGRPPWSEQPAPASRQAAGSERAWCGLWRRSTGPRPRWAHGASARTVSAGDSRAGEAVETGSSRLRRGPGLRPPALGRPAEAPQSAAPPSDRTGRTRAPAGSGARRAGAGDHLTGFGDHRARFGHHRTRFGDRTTGFRDRRTRRRDRWTSRGDRRAADDGGGRQLEVGRNLVIDAFFSITRGAVR